MCCLSSERLSANNGTRVTVIDASQHGVFDSTQEALHDLTAGKHKTYIAQITGIRSLRKIDGVGFYADTPIGRVQFEADNVKIVELLPPSNKRKAAHGSFKKNAKAKGKAKAKEPTSGQDTEPDDEPEDDEPEDDGADGGDDDVSMDSVTKMEEAVVAARTRSNNPLVV
ncbi:hypothetical protein PF008_g19541 [Phytophthora fragariae]|uniref:Uncharacterized protein n=1 Tax=Phytophthora fragariae TaxID=53985 RepID=A0A6G0R2D3_9STRA|nr:hypothetical protein PF008_g19541 [Phytophthora fragariae]